MPAITSGKVLVTGANGYCALWIVERLLAQGFSVRGTVRTPQRAAEVAAVFVAHGAGFEAAVVEDITQEGAFDGVVHDVDAIVHVASPVTLAADAPEAVVGPMMRGTTAVLQAALAHGPRVRRVVLTGSAGAIITAGRAPGRIWSEADWNNAAVDALQTHGRAASAMDKYRAGKTLAERVAWAYVRKHQAEIAWDLVVLHPPWVFGPPRAMREGGVRVSLREWYDVVCRGTKDKTALTTTGSSWVDVRQLADAHVLALQKPDAGGQRIIVSSGSYIWQDWVNVARKIDSRIPPGDETYKEGQSRCPFEFVTEKVDRIMGIRWVSKEETARDMLDAFTEIGMWPVTGDVSGSA